MFLDLVPGDRYQVPDAWYQALGSRRQVLGTRDPVPVPNTRRQVLGARDLVPVPNTRRLVAGTWFLLPGT